MQASRTPLVTFYIPITTQAVGRSFLGSSTCFQFLVDLVFEKKSWTLIIKQTKHICSLYTKTCFTGSHLKIRSSWVMSDRFLNFERWKTQRSCVQVEKLWIVIIAIGCWMITMKWKKTWEKNPTCGTYYTLSFKCHLVVWELLQLGKSHLYWSWWGSGTASFMRKSHTSWCGSTK